MTTLYGIKNCDTVRKARRWCEANNIDFQFHDFRVDGLDEITIGKWLESVSWETLLNKRSRTWQNIDQNKKDTLNQNNAITLMLENPTLIKRPILMTGRDIIVGFNIMDYEKLIS
ncbi:MAG: ArsC family reductase [Methylophaga sp.]|nr:ArsC family reductase [Methylophaga sp.]